VSLIRDLDVVRHGWRWQRPRPRSWAPAERVLPERPTDLGWARLEPVRTIRYLIQRGLMMPFNELMTHPQVEGVEWVSRLDSPVILASNHTSHADTPLLLHALPQRVRERVVVAAAADYFYRRPWLGRLMSLWLNTFPFARTGGAQEVLNRSSQLLKSGWNLLVYPEGTRSEDGRLQPFRPGIGFLAAENRTAVVPMHVSGTHRVLPKGGRVPVPAPVRIRIGQPLYPQREEPHREFAQRVEDAVHELSSGSRAAPRSWIDRWRVTAPARPG
jgi:1-acyl-sn-glycerol-3-phosphate acyltransferase